MRINVLSAMADGRTDAGRIGKPSLEAVRGRILRILFWIGIFMAIAGFILFLQNHFLYIPTRMSLGQVVQGARGLNLELWPSETAEYRALTRTPFTNNIRGTIVVLQGNAGSAIHRAHYADALGSLGFRVFILEYPGYGARRGRPGEKTFVSDVRHTLRQILAAHPEPLYLWGESLGAGVAASVARDRELPIEGIVLLTPWDTLYNIAKVHFRLLPVGLFLRDRYDSIDNLREFHGPKAVVMAGHDEIIPERLTLNLYHELSPPKKLLVFENAGHNDWLYHVDEEWWREVTDYITYTKQ